MSEETLGWHNEKKCGQSMDTYDYFLEDKVISVVLTLGGAFPCETPELLCGLGNVSSASTDIAVGRK